jgi:DNA polymerase
MSEYELNREDGDSALAKLYKEVANCHQCDLARYRTRAVPGEGEEDADIVFIGEAPGWHEDQQGRPFVGPAGHLLEELLASIGLTREQVYICNMIKCRPPQNRDPLLSEIRTCQQWLDHQLELIQPKIIVTLGRYSMARYHPAAALHQQSLRQVIQADMLKIPSLLAQSEETPETEEKPQQLNLF